MTSRVPECFSFSGWKLPDLVWITKTCLDPSAVREQRLAMQDEAYRKVVLPLVQEWNATPGSWLGWHDKKNKVKKKDRVHKAKEDMKKMLGSFDVDIPRLFDDLKYKAAQQEKCEPVYKNTKAVEANGGERLTKKQSAARDGAMKRVRRCVRALRIQLYTHAQFLCSRSSQASKTRSRRLCRIRLFYTCSWKQ